MQASQFFTALLLLNLFQTSSSIFFVSTIMSLSSKVVTIVGGGSVGSTLAKAIDASGKAKSVVIAARNPEKTEGKLAEQGMENLKVEPITSAIASSDILILATPSAYSDEAIEALAKSLGDCSGKIIIDATNPLTEFQDGLQVRWPQGTSGGEVLQNYLGESAKVYKAFNICGVEQMAAAAGKDMFFCGPDNDKALAAEVVAAVGFNPIYVGAIRYARNLEAMAELWIHCAIPPLPGANLGRDWTFGFASNQPSK